MNRNINTPGLNGARRGITALAVLATFWLGLTFAAPAHGSTLSQDTGKGDITGQVTVNGQPTQGIKVELRQRTNSGQDSTLSTASTDGTGTYHFASQPSAANDAFYYLLFRGSKGTLSAWYSFPIIYTMGSQVTVPAIDLGDVELGGPAQNSTLTLPGKLQWKARRMGETYRVFVYAAGKLDKPVLDSGSLGTGTEFSIGEGGLQPGSYDAIVQVRDAVAGYGQSQARFHFSVGTAPAQQSEGQVAGSVQAGGSSTTPAQLQPQAPQKNGDQGTANAGSLAPSQSPQQGSTASAKPEIKLNLSADKTSVDKGGDITYKVEIENAGTGAASGLVVTDKLPDGVGVDTSGVKAGDSKVTIDGSTVTINVGDVAPGAKSVIEIPAKVASGADRHVSNQASATYAGATDVVQSNAYIAEVAEPLAGPGQQPQSQQPAQQQAQPAQGQSAPAPAAPAAPVNNQALSSQSKPAQAPQQAHQEQQAPASHSSMAPQSKPVQAPASSAPARPAAPKTQSNLNVQGKASAPAQKQPSAAMPQTGGSFPIILAVLLLLVTLLARYLRGYIYRRA